MSLRNRLVLPLVLSSLAFLVACGGSGTNSPVPPPSGAFSNTNFNGTYAFSVSGADILSTNQGSPFMMAGTLQACGCNQGTIAGGTVDLVDFSGIAPGSSIGSNSVYSITKDGRGTARLFITTTSNVSLEIDVDFVLSSSSHGLIMRYDGLGTGSGTVDLQPAAVAQSSIETTPYAFMLSGFDGLGNPLSTAGAFTLDSNGNIITTGATAGVEDFTYKFPAAVYVQQVLSGSVLVGSGSTPGTATLTTTPFGTLTFDVYAVDATHLKLIESDGVYLLVGDVFSAPTASIPSSGLVFAMAGLDPGGNPFVAGGTVDSAGNGLEDINDDGAVDGGGSTVTPYSFTASFAATPAGSGRFQAILTNFLGGTTFVAYPSSAGVLMLEIDSTASAGITSGIALGQSTGAALATAQGYAMDLSGSDLFNNGVEVDEIAQFTTANSSAKGLIDENDFSVGTGTSNLIGTITPGSGGVGSISFTSAAPFAGLFYYAADSSNAVAISTDSGQVTVGTIQGQSTPTSQADLVQRHLAMVRAASRSRSASKHGQGHFSVKK